MPGRQTRIILVLAVFCMLCALLLLSQGVTRVINTLGGAYEYAPEDAEWVLSESAQALVDAAYADMQGKRIVDHQVLALSLGQRDGPGFTNRSFVNPELLSWRYPRDRWRSRVYFSATGIVDEQHADEHYLARLVRQARALPADHRLKLAALDQRYDREGSPRVHDTPLYVDNDYVWFLAQQYPELFSPVVSVHPDRKDALQALKKWAERGVKTVNWRPNVQGIDPADERLEDYYQALVDNDLTLFTHAGEAHGLAGGNPGYGNPLRYRKALEMGVRVVMADCGGVAIYQDPEAPDTEPRPGYEWFVQMLGDARYADKLYGDISGLTHRQGAPAALTFVLQNPQIFEQLVYASDYPLPAVNYAIDLDKLVDGGFITAQQAPGLREIYNVNPLMFDFVLQRHVRLPHTDLGFPAVLFTRSLGD